MNFLQIIFRGVCVFFSLGHFLATALTQYSFLLTLTYLYTTHNPEVRSIILVHVVFAFLKHVSCIKFIFNVCSQYTNSSEQITRNYIACHLNMYLNSPKTFVFILHNYRYYILHSIIKMAPVM